MTVCWMVDESQCLCGCSTKKKVATPARNGIPVILWAPRPYIHCTTPHHVLSVHTYQASRWSLPFELLWVISYTWSTGAQPLVIYPGVLCIITNYLCKSSPSTDFHGVVDWGACSNVLIFQFLFKWNNNWRITEDLYKFLSAHLALFGQEIAIHKSSWVECSMHFMSFMFLCKPRGFWYS